MLAAPAGRAVRGSAPVMVAALRDIVLILKRRPRILLVEQNLYSALGSRIGLYYPETGKVVHEAPAIESARDPIPGSPATSGKLALVESQ